VPLSITYTSPSATYALQRFALFSKLELEKASKMVNEVSQRYTDVLKFFGEDAKQQCCDFFGLIDRFMEQFDSAVDFVEKEEAAKVRLLLPGVLAKCGCDQYTHLASLLYSSVKLVVHSLKGPKLRLSVVTMLIPLRSH
jgi:hypothetical protein